MWGLVFTAFWHLSRLSGGWRWSLLPDSFQRLFRKPALSVLLLLLLIPTISGLWSEDTGYWLERVRVRLPFLVLPWVFANLPPLRKSQLQLVLYIFVWWMVLLGLGVMINYFLHQDVIIQAMHEGRPMPVPRNHIRFSLMTATAVLAGGWLWIDRFKWRYTWESGALASAVVFLFVFCHFLSVRSGIAALYLALIFTLIRYVWLTRRWKLAVVFFALLFAAPWIAVRTMPSLEKKVAYMVYDWERYSNQSGENYSDAERWVSLKTGWLIWQEAPWLGVGAGDLRQEVAQSVADNFPGYVKTPKLPHNQFLYILTGTGILGLILSLIAFLYPLSRRQYQRHYLFISFQIMLFASFMVEYTIETAMGVAWHLFFSLWYMAIADCGQEG